MQSLLPLLAFLLLPGAEAEEIIGGHEAKAHSLPYMVFVQVLHDGKKSRCSGVLVREDFVLTAAHCWGRFINITLGAHNIKKQEKTQQHIPVKKAFCYPDYNRKVFSGDIMLLQLKIKAKRTAAVRSLPLPGRKARVKPGQMCSVAGWGQVSVDKDSLSTTLQEVELTVQEDQKCEGLFPKYYRKATEICVGDQNKNKTGFKGDSGAPLVCKNTVQGIFCCASEKGTPPGIFTKVSPFLHWIKKTMKLSKSRPSNFCGQQFLGRI
ncbi:PREDICTED: granzyme H-like [Elephantulus edwardii]|uniref:granzyme H-like n=1 Tax=Elephantulus edwardii TaxID=28737 RepID=UPI0003F083A5|nr:PREDICTED: granzyme H-like [Elephantulus edwardii]